jgi:hypothetical protein
MNIEAEHTRVTLLLLTLPPSIITEALECDSESQIRRWARGVTDGTTRHMPDHTTCPPSGRLSSSLFSLVS